MLGIKSCTNLPNFNLVSLIRVRCALDVSKGLFVFVLLLLLVETCITDIVGDVDLVKKKYHVSY